MIALQSRVRFFFVPSLDTGLSYRFIPHGGVTLESNLELSIESAFLFTDSFSFDVASGLFRPSVLPTEFSYIW